MNNCSQEYIYENLIGSKILEHVLGIYKTSLKSANGIRKRGKGGTKCSNWDTVEIIWDGDGDKASTKTSEKHGSK